jgi:hypothetical protein
MKIEIEKLLFVIYLIVLVAVTIYFVTPSSDNYYYYLIGRYISRDPSFLWSTNLTGSEYLLSSQSPFLTVPPLTQIIYAFLFLFNLPPSIVDVLSILVIGYILWKINKKAIPFLFISFLFIKAAAFGGLDIFIIALALSSFYFFDRRPLLSGFFAGLCPLVKGTGFIFLFSYFVAIMVFKRNEIFRKDFYKSKFFVAMIVSILVLSPWYLRNFIFFKGDIIGTLTGATPGTIASEEQTLKSGFQQTQPERYWWDTSGFYPLPIDLLFYAGLVFVIINLYKNRKLELEHIFIIIYALAYFTMQILDIRFLMTIRHYMPIFPLLAIQMTKGFRERYLKFAYIICLVMLAFFVLSLPKYSFNQYNTVVEPACKQINSAIDSQPVFVNAFHGWFVTYKCDLNTTIINESKWTLDFEQGRLYLTNKTNITGA